MLYHASGQVVEFPEIRISRYTKDFSWGFYCTEDYKQAKKWAKRVGSRPNNIPIINHYTYNENKDLSILKFKEINDGWLDFIARCRAGEVHDYDIVEGPMADDTVWDYAADYINGSISRKAFWELAKFRHPTHQISFHTMRALKCLSFERSVTIDE